MKAMTAPSSPEDERRKRQRLKAGDPDAFAEVFREFQPGVLNYLYRLSNGNRPLSRTSPSRSS